MKWMSRPSISVMKCGSAFRRASHLLQSYSVPQYWMSFCIVASCTPCVGPAAAGVDQIRREAASDTNSRSGQRVAATRRRRSSISSGGKLTVKGRIGASPVAARSVPGSMLMAPAAAVAARSSRRVGDSDIADMISSCVVPMQSMRHTDRPSAEPKSITRWYRRYFCIGLEAGTADLEKTHKTRGRAEHAERVDHNQVVAGAYVGSGLPACSATMYSANQSGQFTSY